MSNQLFNRAGIQKLAVKFASDNLDNQKFARTHLEQFLELDEEAVVSQLSQLLQNDRNVKRRIGYVRALSGVLSPNALLALLKQLNIEFDTNVWKLIHKTVSEAIDVPPQALVNVVLKPQPLSLSWSPILEQKQARIWLENLTLNAQEHETRVQAASALLNYAAQSQRPIPITTINRLASFLGSSEDYSYPAVEVLARSQGEIQLPLMTSISNPESETFVKTILEQVYPNGDWTRTLFPRIDLPIFCKPDESTPMRVQLSMPERATHRTPVNIDFREGEKIVKIQVSVTSAAFDVQTSWKTITIERSGDSSIAHFEITPLFEGKALLTVEFFREGHRVGLITARTFITPSENPWSTTDTEIIHWLRQQVISLENPLTRLNDKPYGRSFVARLKCSSNPGDQICWSDPIDPKEHITSDNINWQDLEVLLDEIRPVLANVLIRADQLTARFGPLFALSSDGVEDDQDYKEYKLQIKYAVLELESLGKLLYKKIIGGKFEEITKEFKPGHPLQFYTDKHLAWIPWELIYDEKQKAFWGELYPIGRPAYPLTDTHTHRIDSNGNNQSDHQVINIAGDQLVKHGLPELITQLQKAFKGMKVKGNVEMPLVFMPVTDVREKINDCDIVHLTCHGDKNERGVYYLRLGPKEIYQLKLHHICSFNFKPQSLIFTNACTTISGALLFNEYSNFGWEIYQRNADTYLGTIGPVPSGEAIVFAETFYGYLIRDKLPAGIALWKAKQTFSKRKPCTPFYLLYCLYGNPKWCW